MRVNVVKDDISFKSGYPTFGQGHLGYIPEARDVIYLDYKPRTGLLEDGARKLDVLA